MIVGILSFFTLMASDVPTNGQLMREIRTDQAAFDKADTNGDDVISAEEFEDYKRYRRSPEGSKIAAATAPLDSNNDGAAVPCELYAEADCPAGERRPRPTAAQADCRRQDGYYKVDDRNGAVYCPEY